MSTLTEPAPPGPASDAPTRPPYDSAPLYVPSVTGPTKRASDER
jgi:hypothetical protein